jgi:hypothetical protein
MSATTQALTTIKDFVGVPFCRDPDPLIERRRGQARPLLSH